LKIKKNHKITNVKLNEKFSKGGQTPRKEQEVRKDVIQKRMT